MCWESAPHLSHPPDATSPSYEYGPAQLVSTYGGSDCELKRLPWYKSGTTQRKLYMRLEGLFFPGKHYEGVTFSRSWVLAKSLSDQLATQSQGETAAIANALCSDAVAEQVVSIQ